MIWKKATLVTMRKNNHPSDLSAELPGRICVTMRGRERTGSGLAPPRNVNPKLLPSFSSAISTRLQSTEKVDWAVEKTSLMQHTLHLRLGDFFLVGWQIHTHFNLLITWPIVNSPSGHISQGVWWHLSNRDMVSNRLLVIWNKNTERK